jgi:antitoxin component of RelBE/YafQ-DinJ toxin-antitoxin module
MNKAHVTFMIEELVKEMALRLMDERGLTMKQALDTVYNSETYSKVLDIRTGLFSQSTAYVYSILETEILTGKIG